MYENGMNGLRDGGEYEYYDEMSASDEQEYGDTYDDGADAGEEEMNDAYNSYSSPQMGLITGPQHGYYPSTEPQHFQHTMAQMNKSATK